MRGEQAKVCDDTGDILRGRGMAGAPVTSP